MLEKLPEEILTTSGEISDSMENTRPPIPDYNGKSYIVDLPDELLDRILCLAVSNRDLWQPGCLATNRNARPLLLVCQRFYQISVPLLYREVQCDYGTESVSPSPAWKKLHRTLRDKPALREHCRTIQVHVPDIGGRGDLNSADWSYTNDIVSWLTGVRHFTLYGGFEQNADANWAFLGRVAQCMPNIENLKLHREGFNLCLQPLYDLPIFPCLASLSISGVSQDRETDGAPKVRYVRYFYSLDNGCICPRTNGTRTK
jgi:hypothetical protein